MSNKPIVRWTFGPFSKTGHDILRYSVKLFQREYNDEFDLFICVNNLSEEEINLVTNDSVFKNCKFLIQDESSNKLNMKISGPAWKLVPPRLNINTHEIVIDNDLVLFKRSKYIEDFLNGDHIISTKSSIRSYGNLDRYVGDFLINTGLLGFPPKFDFKKYLDKKIRYILKVNHSKIKHYNLHFNEQGLVAMVFQDLDPIVIPLEEINVCWSQPIVWPCGCPRKVDVYKAKSGLHFVGANYSEVSYWNEYKKHFLFN